MSTGNAIVKYFKGREDVAALLVDKSEDPKFIDAFFCSGISIFNVQFSYIEDSIFTHSVIPESAAYELDSDRLEMFNKLSCMLNNEYLSIDKQNRFEYGQLFRYKRVDEIDGLLDLSIRNTRGMCDICGKDVTFHALSKVISNLESKRGWQVKFIK